MASFPVYAGFRYHPVQYGNGFLDLLKTAAQWILPIFTGSAGNFLSGVAQRTLEGEGLAQAAKGSLKGAALTAGQTALKKLQGGGGKKRRHAKKYKRSTSKRIKTDDSKFNF